MKSMKIAYLMHYMKNNFEEITENLDILINQGDDVYIMVNDDDLRDDLILSYCDTPNLHVAHHQQTALPADMSLPRGFIVLMKDALEYEKEDGSFTYDRFITMTDGMIPTKSKAKLVEYLEAHEDEDIYYEVDNSDDNEEVKKRFENYAFFTNSYDFQKSKTIRAMNKMTSSLVHSFKKREIEDTIYISYPWFVLTHESAQAGDNSHMQSIAHGTNRKLGQLINQQHEERHPISNPQPPPQRRRHISKTTQRNPLPSENRITFNAKNHLILPYAKRTTYSITPDK
mgnify:CR=1 FL=1